MPKERVSKNYRFILPGTATIIIATGLMIFILKLGSRRSFNEHRARGELQSNIQGLFHTCAVAHGDSVNYFLKSTEYSQIHKLRLKIMRKLIRNKTLEQFKLLGHYLIVVDATGSISFGKPHCSECLSRKLNNGEKIYYHPVLEAKLVCSNGFVFSLATEFLRNLPGKTVQDCELKAFYRLAKKIKKDFPRLNICLLADGLYANEPTLRLCNEYDWKYIIVLKENSLSTVWQEVEAFKLLKEQKQFSRKYTLPNKTQLTEQYNWCLDIDYHGLAINVLEYNEKTDNQKESYWAWITNFTPKPGNCMLLAQGGRMRWKIENEGFNSQKNAGYNLEHAYSHDINAQKNFYLLMQIAHLLNQLVEKGSLLLKCFDGKLPSLKNITIELLAEIKMLALPWNIWRTQPVSYFQIRFS